MITFDGDECWVCPRWAFARLVRSASMFTRYESDLETLESAVTGDWLNLPQMDEQRAERLAEVLRKAAGWLRAELIAEKSGLEADEELALSLTPLATQLTLMLRNRAKRRAAAAPPPLRTTTERLTPTYR